MNRIFFLDRGGFVVLFYFGETARSDLLEICQYKAKAMRISGKMDWRRTIATSSYSILATAYVLGRGYASSKKWFFAMSEGSISKFGDPGWA